MARRFRVIIPPVNPSAVPVGETKASGSAKAEPNRSSLSEMELTVFIMYGAMAKESFVVAVVLDIAISPGPGSLTAQHEGRRPRRYRNRRHASPQK